MAFITNFQSPVELNDLMDRFMSDKKTNVDHLLADSGSFTEWTCDRECRVGDAVYFMCAKSSKDHMRRVLKEAREFGNANLVMFAEKELALYKQYAGNIMAVGIVAAEPFQSESSGYAHVHWKSRWYAPIAPVVLLDSPVDISEFRDFIKVSRTGAITRLTLEQDAQLRKLILSRNEIVL